MNMLNNNSITFVFQYYCMLFHGGNDPELYIHRLILVILRGFLSGSSRVLLRFCMGAIILLEK